jgi:hypothetical protein
VFGKHLTFACFCSGLGTSTAAEGKAYFSDLAKHRRALFWSKSSLPLPSSPSSGEKESHNQQKLKGHGGLNRKIEANTSNSSDRNRSSHFNEEGTEEDDASRIDLAFRKSRADHRKLWLLNYRPGTMTTMSV